MLVRVYGQYTPPPPKKKKKLRPALGDPSASSRARVVQIWIEGLMLSGFGNSWLDI